MAAKKQDNNDFIDLDEFKQFMFDKIVPLEDLTDISGRKLEKSFPYWRKHGLLPFIPKGQWVKLSFAQLIWIRMLESLRSLGYSIINTQKLCDYLFKDAYNNELPKKNIEQNIKVLLKKKLAGTISDDEIITLQSLEEIREDKQLLEVLKLDINYLTTLITSSISSGEEAGLLIFSDGEIGERLGTKYFSHKAEGIDPTKPHIYLPINYYLLEFIDSDDLQSMIMLQLLNDDEKSVLKELRNKNVSEITIKKNENDIVRIASIRNGVITGEKMTEIRRILGLKNYEEINLSTRNEKTLSFKRTNKKIK